ncbi:MAG: FecR domain-containing protein [Burkholderiaceae bacterium]
MSRATSASADIDPAILREAADWLMRLHAGDAGPAEWAAVERWRTTSPAHGLAWKRAEGLLGDLRRIPGGPVRAALERPDARRRRLLRLLWLPALPAGWLAWRHFSIAGERWQTATGEQRGMRLADGTRLLLNTDTGIAVQFDARTRLIRLLSGEILVTSAPDPSPSPRPLIVATADGSVRPIGTRFSVRRSDGDADSRVAVFEGRVEVEAAGQRRQVARGQRIAFDATGPGLPETADDVADEAWANGMIVARRMRLADLVAELDRYRPGRLSCHPDVARMHVSGTFPALDSERSLQLLAASFPLKLRYRTRYWVTVEAA